ncbi:MAG TPA: ATP-binding protein [Blastocatellia bacterium]|nr:ATP-binding protein [Blastocatellia bacterium]
MSAQYRFNLFHVLGLLTVVIGAIVIAMACLAIAGWVFGFGVFPYLNQSGAHLGITPDAALCFILCWVSLWVLRESTGKFSVELEPDEPHKFESENAGEGDKPEEKGSVHNLAVNLAAGAFSRRLAQLFASVAVVISLSVLAGYLFGLDVWPAQASGWATPLGPVLSAWGDFSGHGILTTRMAPSAAFAFLLNGVALTMLDVETRGGARPAQHLGLIALFLSLLVALGHVYQISPPQSFILIRGWPQMTTLMAIIFVALSIGVVCARPRNGLVSLLGAANSGGYIARRLLPAAIVIPVTFGSGALLAVKAGYFEGSFGVMLVTMASALSFLGLIWRSSARLRDRDAERVIAETELSKAYSDLLKHVGEQDAELRRANQDIWAERIERERLAEERQEGLAERRRIEAQLHDSEARFNMVVSSAPAMIWISDADKVCNFFNKGWLDHTGRAGRAGRAGRTGEPATSMAQNAENGWAEDIHPDDVRDCLEIYQKAFDERREFTTEYRLRRQDGQYRWVLNNGAPLFDSGGADVADKSEGAEGAEGTDQVFAGYIGYCLDIHERKERERLVEEEAEELRRLKKEFLATVSHELRAPLNIIQGWVQILRDGRHRLSPHETAQALERIERAARALNCIISDLLDVSRINTDKRLITRRIRLAAVVESAVESLRSDAGAKGIDIRLNLDDQDAQVAGNFDRLRQIVCELLSNAIKFTPDRGHVHVALERAGEYGQITVSDTGVGITPKFLPFVFDQFRQEDGSSTRPQGGLGLGLWKVRELAEMHGGSVSAQSPGPDQGATFALKLPLILPLIRPLTNSAGETDGTGGTSGMGATGPFYRAASFYMPQSGFDMDPSGLMDSALELHGLRVLAVDNDSDARDLIKTILTQYGAVVETASSTRQALALFERPDEWQPELLISDIEMPEADGYQLIRKLREMESRRGSKRAPAIALTAYARTEDRLRSLSAGFHMHVAKPVEPVELLTIVASLTGRLGRTRNPYGTDNISGSSGGGSSGSGSAALYETENIAGSMARDMAGQEAR